jgi:methyltransferase (TIGR00027 family)
MNKIERTEANRLDDESAAVPFTARLNAYYRAVESKESRPLLLDPFAERLAGDMAEYFERHKRFIGMGGSQIARSYYIENDLLRPWFATYETSQIVLLGAGLDTRAYRLNPLQSGSHTIFEIDLPIIIRYKERILRDEQPLCSLVRIPADLSKSEWKKKLLKFRFSRETPTFWILEGLAYYLDRTAVHDLLRELSEMSAEGSELFLDVCVPALADLRWGPFTDHFKWGITIEDTPDLLVSAGWHASCSYLDDHSHGKDVGQKGIILVHGALSASQDVSQSEAFSIADKELSDSELEEFSSTLMRRLIPEIEGIIDSYTRDSERGLSLYIEFIKRTQSDLKVIARAQKNPVLLGKISPRLLGDPLSIERGSHNWSSEETESYLVGYLEAILQLVYCGMKGLNGNEYQNVSLDRECHDRSDIKGMELLRCLLAVMKHEAGS